MQAPPLLLRIKVKYDKVIESLNGLSVRTFVLFGLLLYTLVVISIVRKYHFDVTSMVRFGEYYALQNEGHIPENAVVFVGNEEFGGNGYDGQIFYFFAATFFDQEVWPHGFNNAYRAPRLGYPILTAVLEKVIPGDRSFAISLILLQILLFGTSIFAFFRLLPIEKKFYTLFYACSPFGLQSFDLLVSDQVMVSLCIIGSALVFQSLTNRFSHGIRWIGAWLCFSLAILTKESSLFYLFPLGLFFLFRKDIIKAGILVAALLPTIAWQIYLRKVHGMVPAEVLTIFLSPFSGIWGLFVEFFGLLGSPSISSFKMIAKMLPRFLLLIFLIDSIRLGFLGKLSDLLPARLATLLVAFSIILADHYFFWGIYDNVGRMFTLLVPLVLLIPGDGKNTSLSRFIIILLFVLNLGRIIASPAMPFTNWKKGFGKTIEAPLLYRK